MVCCADSIHRKGLAMMFPSSLQEILLSLAPVMTLPTFHNFMALLLGWCFASRRTVTVMIQAAGLVGGGSASFDLSPGVRFGALVVG